MFFSPVGWILIDRCGKHFGTILNYLRDGAVPLPETRRETEELLAEAKYYLVQGLADECTAALQVKPPLAWKMTVEESYEQTSSHFHTSPLLSYESTHITFNSTHEHAENTKVAKMSDSTAGQ